MFKPKLPQQHQGFTLVEVLVAIVITLLFVAVAMNAMVLAAFFKARAQKYAEATNWIQADLENVRYQAANFPYTSLTANANAGDSSINVAAANGFAVNDKLEVGSDPGTYTISDISGNKLTITPNLGTAQLQNAVVVAVLYTSLTANANAGDSSINVASTDSFAVNDKLKVGSDSATYTISGISGNTLTITPNLKTAQSQNAVVAAITSTSLAADAKLGDPSINVASGGYFAVNDKLKVGSDPTTYIISGISGNVLNITPNLGTAQSNGAVVVATRCNASSVAPRFADGLERITSINLPITPKISNRTGKAFLMTRTTTLSGTPSNVLQVSYNVSLNSKYASLAANANVGASSINVASVSNFAVNDKLKVGSDPGTYTINGISGNTLTITPTLGTAQLQNAVVAAATYTSLTANANAGDSSINVAAANGFAVNNKLQIGSDPGTYTISGISGNTLTITPNLGTTQPQNAVVAAATSTSLTANANAGASSINVAAANSFAVNNKLQIGSDPGTYTISGISGNTLTIAPTLGTAQLQNAVVTAAGSLAHLYTEVIPDATLQCR